MTTAHRSMRARNVVVVGAVLLVLGIVTLLWGLLGDSNDAVNFGAGAVAGSGLAVGVGLWWLGRERRLG